MLNQYNINIHRKDIYKMLKCDTETFSIIKIKDIIQLKFMKEEEFKSCLKKLSQ
jgi:hypothetical protein